MGFTHIIIHFVHLFDIPPVDIPAGTIEYTGAFVIVHDGAPGVSRARAYPADRIECIEIYPPGVKKETNR